MVENGLKYRDSRMASADELLADLSAMEISRRDVRAAGGPVLYRKDRTVYTDPSDLHSLIVGDTGSMKTLRFVLPLIYSSALAGESMVIVDPKGELVRKTGDFLKSVGYHPLVLSWRSPADSPDQWNPFSCVEETYQKGDRGKASNLLNDLMTSLFFQRYPAVKDPYWNDSAGLLARGLAKLILASGENLSIQNLLRWRHKNLMNGTVKNCVQVLPADSDISQDLSGYLNLTASNTKSCIESTFDQLTGLFSASPDLTKMMSSSTFRMKSIGRRKRAVFLVIPDEKTSYHFLAALFIKQCYEQLLDLADQREGRLPVRVNFILEEFCNMPRLEDIGPMLTAARSRNIRFHLVIQSYSQMVDQYGECLSRTVMDNCGNLIYLHTREIGFLEYISKLAGRNEYGRPLLSASRLQHLKRNETLIFHDRCYPILVQDIPLIFEYPLE